MAGPNLPNDAVGQSPGIVFTAVEQDGVGGAEEGSGGARGVDLVPGGEVVFFALFAAAFCPNGWAGIDEIFEGAVGADDRADIAPLHDEGGGEAEFTLEIDQIFAEFGKSGNDRDGRVHLGKAGVGGQVTGPFAQRDLPVLDLGMKIHFFEELFQPGAGRRIVTGLEGQKSEGAIHCAGVDVDVAQIVGDEAGDGAFP